MCTWMPRLHIIMTIMGFSKNLLIEDELETSLKDKWQICRNDNNLLQDESFLLAQNKTIARINFNF